MHEGNKAREWESSKGNLVVSVSSSKSREKKRLLTRQAFPLGLIEKLAVEAQTG